MPTIREYSTPGDSFRTYREANDETAWYVPPYFRRSGTKRGRRSHLVPCVGFAAHAADRLDRLADYEGSEGWLFPARSGAKDGRPHAEASLFNDQRNARRRIFFACSPLRVCDLWRA
jgi:integrase